MNLGRLMIDVPSSHSRLGIKVAWLTVSLETHMKYVPGGLGIMDRQGVEAAWNQGFK
jgi:hypothetical protein